MQLILLIKTFARCPIKMIDEAASDQQVLDPICYIQCLKKKENSIFVFQIFYFCFIDCYSTEVQVWQWVVMQCHFCYPHVLMCRRSTAQQTLMDLLNDVAHQCSCVRTGTQTETYRWERQPQWEHRLRTWNRSLTSLISFPFIVACTINHFYFLSAKTVTPLSRRKQDDFFF